MKDKTVDYIILDVLACILTNRSSDGYSKKERALKWLVWQKVPVAELHMHAYLEKTLFWTLMKCLNPYF